MENRNVAGLSTYAMKNQLHMHNEKWSNTRNVSSLLKYLGVVELNGCVGILAGSSQIAVYVHAQ